MGRTVPFQARSRFGMRRDLCPIGSWTRAREGTRDRAVRFLQPAKQVSENWPDGAANEAASATQRRSRCFHSMNSASTSAATIWQPPSPPAKSCTSASSTRPHDSSSPRLTPSPSIEELEAERPAAAAKAVTGHILKGTAVVTRHHRYWPALIETLSELTRRSTLDSRVPTRLLRQLAGGCCEGAN